MVVLDADSVMSGKALVTLARLWMQTRRWVCCRPCEPGGPRNVVRPLAEFAARLNSQMLSSGLAFWQLSESNYWGHNAIMRVRVFAPALRIARGGLRAVGGEILSHDFVEARAHGKAAGSVGWCGPRRQLGAGAVESHRLCGSRPGWAQGNLQHLGVMPLRGCTGSAASTWITGVLA